VIIERTRGPLNRQRDFRGRTRRRELAKKRRAKNPVCRSETLKLEKRRRGAVCHPDSCVDESRGIVSEKKDGRRTGRKEKTWRPYACFKEKELEKKTGPRRAARFLSERKKIFTEEKNRRDNMFCVLGKETPSGSVRGQSGPSRY